MKKSNQIIKNKIKIFKPKIIDVKNGDIYKVIQKEHEFFRGFGELYFSSIKMYRSQLSDKVSCKVQKSPKISA